MTKPQECPHCTAPEKDIEPIYLRDKIVGWLCNNCSKVIDWKGDEK